LLYLISRGDKNDEAQKKLGSELARCLVKHHKVFSLPSDRFFSPVDLINASVRFKPDLIHVFLRLKIKVLIYLTILKTICPSSRLVISAFQPPEGSKTVNVLLSLLNPSLTLALSQKTKKIFQKAGCQTKISYAGIDTEAFVPSSSSKGKEDLRKRYGIHLTKSMILHVGHLTEGRNLSLLKGLAKKKNVAVVVVASPTQSNQVLLRELMDAGIKVFIDFYPNVEVFYQMADCYVFPTQSTSHAIELPLSVFEAMSCNLPVVTTPFGALPELFEEDASFRYVNCKVDDFHAKVQETLEIHCRPSNRDKVLRFDWAKVVEEIESIYYNVLGKNI